MEDNSLERSLFSSIKSIVYLDKKKKSLYESKEWSYWKDEQNIDGEGYNHSQWVDLSQDYQEEEIDIGCYVVKKSSTLAPVDKNPYEGWASKRISLSHIKVFGCDSFVHIPKEGRQKLNSKSKKCIFVR